MTCGEKWIFREVLSFFFCFIGRDELVHYFIIVDMDNNRDYDDHVYKYA